MSEIRNPVSDQRGVSLLEVLVALIVLSIALSALAGLSYQATQRSYDSSIESYATGVATEELGLLSVLPWDSVAARVGCETVDDEGYPHERCLDVRDINKREREVMLIITPEVPFARPDTVIFRRARPRVANPFM